MAEIESTETINIRSKAKSKIRQQSGYPIYSTPIVTISKANGKCTNISLSGFDDNWDGSQIPLIIELLQEASKTWQ